ncbi:MAG: hypothetical protein ACI9DF_003614 [Verrucomicrobiales bacterium]|jgi:hypothetical protein
MAEPLAGGLAGEALGTTKACSPSVHEASKPYRLSPFRKLSGKKLLAGSIRSSTLLSKVHSFNI